MEYSSTPEATYDIVQTQDKISTDAREHELLSAENIEEHQEELYTGSEHDSEGTVTPEHTASSESDHSDLNVTINSTLQHVEANSKIHSTPQSLDTQETDSADRNQYMTCIETTKNAESTYENLQQFSSSLPNESQLSNALTKLGHGAVLNEQPHDPYNTFPKVYKPSDSTREYELTPVSSHGQQNSSYHTETSLDANLYVCMSPKPGGNTWQGSRSRSQTSSSMVSNQVYGRRESISAATDQQVVKCLPMFFCLETGKAYVNLNTTHSFPMHQLVEVNPTNEAASKSAPSNLDTTNASAALPQPTDDKLPIIYQAVPTLTSMINPLYEDRFEPKKFSTAKDAEQNAHKMGDLEVNRHHSFLYCTIIMALAVGLCLDFPVLLLFFVAAITFAKKASENKERGRINLVKKYGRRALVLNIAGGIVHTLVVLTIIIVFFVVVFVVQ